MISHQHKCVFVHIPKTAGTSIEKKLGHFETLKRGVQDHRAIRDIEPLSGIDLIRIAFPYHIGFAVAEIKKRWNGTSGRMPRKDYRSYFKFTFVRNSWSRVYSWYKNVMRDETHRQQNGVAEGLPFDEFVRNHLTSYLIRPQLEWITSHDGQVPMDFIGRFENLEQDFARVGEALKLEDASLPRLVSSGLPASSYVDAYDDASRRIVADRFAREIEYFGFRFGE